MPSCHNNIEPYTNSNNLYSQYGGSTRRSTRRRSTRTRRRSTRTRRRSIRRSTKRNRRSIRRSTTRRNKKRIDESTYSLPSFSLLST